MYTATRKEKLEGAATVAATLLLVAAPPAALAAILRRDSRHRDQIAKTRERHDECDRGRQAA
ncbi:MAG TPA: hypothetical protein VHZ33_36370 [Trebonia sp.]|jgi:hypothetical protein|nr:hypothetical protein [Trebonia sp.]